MMKIVKKGGQVYVLYLQTHRPCELLITSSKIFIHHSNPSAFKPEEIRTLRDQITSNLERAWEITGRSEDELTGVMVQISQVVAKGFKESQ